MKPIARALLKPPLLLSFAADEVATSTSKTDSAMPSVFILYGIFLLSVARLSINLKILYNVAE
jgi:hypothetical protein